MTTHSIIKCKKCQTIIAQCRCISCDKKIEYRDGCFNCKDNQTHMKLKSIEIISEALGEASVLFMSQECKGTEIVMPTEELSRIADETNRRIIQTIRKEVEGKEKPFIKSIAYTKENEQAREYNNALSDILTLLNSLKEK